jgi:hypothetical protein
VTAISLKFHSPLLFGAIAVAALECRGRAERPPDAWNSTAVAALAVETPFPSRPVYKIGGEVLAPRQLGRADLPIPDSCRERHRFEGDVFVYQALITETGEVENVRTLKKPIITPPCPEWEDQQIKALSRWRYEPATLKGKPVAVELTITQIIDFR